MPACYLFHWVHLHICFIQCPSDECFMSMLFIVHSYRLVFKSWSYSVLIINSLITQSSTVVTTREKNNHCLNPNPNYSFSFIAIKLKTILKLNWHVEKMSFSMLNYNSNTFIGIYISDYIPRQR